MTTTDYCAHWQATTKTDSPATFWGALINAEEAALSYQSSFVAQDSDHARRAELLHELAVRSTSADSGLDRDLEDDINRNAWGINGG
jgi:hypothetical protein